METFLKEFLEFLTGQWRQQRKVIMFLLLGVFVLNSRPLQIHSAPLLCPAVCPGRLTRIGPWTACLALWRLVALGQWGALWEMPGREEREVRVFIPLVPFLGSCQVSWLPFWNHQAVLTLQLTGSPRSFFFFSFCPSRPGGIVTSLLVLGHSGVSLFVPLHLVCFSTPSSHTLSRRRLLFNSPHIAHLPGL